MKTHLSTLSVLIAASSLAWAEETGPGVTRGSKPLRPPEKDQATPEVLFKRLDRNHDKALNFREFKAMPEFKGNADKAEQVFKELDLNDDGQLRFDEFRRHFAPPPPDKGHNPEAIFKKLDKDGNGMLSLEEFTADRDAEKAARMFKELDQNRDGQLSLDEFRRQFGPPPPVKGPSPEALFEKLDKDDSATLSLEEFKDSPRARENPEQAERLFNELDTDSDSLLTLDEFRKMFHHQAPDHRPAKQPHQPGGDSLIE